MDLYGLIGGKDVNFMTDKINEKMDSGEIIGVAKWVGIDHFQRTVKSNREYLRKLDKIMVVDGAFIKESESLNDRDTAKRALNDFLYLEGILKRELDGVFLVLYTKSPVLDAMIKNHYQKDSISKYEGTINLLATAGYQASGIGNIFSTKYKKFSEDNNNLVGKDSEEDISRKIAEQAEIYKLLGQREELRSLMDSLNKKLDLVDKQLNNYLIGDRSDDLDVVSELVGDKGKRGKTITEEIEGLLKR